MALEGVGVAVDGVRLEQLGHADGEIGGELAAGTAALAFPAGVQLAPGHDAVGHPLEHEVEAHRLDDAGDGGTEVGERGFEVQRTARAGMGQEVGDVDAECAHVRPASTGTGGTPVPEEPLVRRVSRRSSARSGR